jgi:hypothetical protein
VYTQQHEVKLFINGLGGTHPVTFWVFFVGGLSLCFTLQTVQTWFMGYWAEQYDIYPPEQVNIALCVSIFHHFSNFHYFPADYIGLTIASYLTIYGLILLAMVISYTTGSGVFMFGSIRASRTIHRKLIESVLGTTLRCISSCPSTALH